MYQLEQMLHFSRLSGPDDLDEAHLREHMWERRRTSPTKAIVAAPAKARESGRLLLKELHEIERAELKRIAKARFDTLDVVHSMPRMSYCIADASGKKSSVIDDLNALMLTSSTAGNTRTRKLPLPKTVEASRFGSADALAGLSCASPGRVLALALAKFRLVSCAFEQECGEELVSTFVVLEQLTSRGETEYRRLLIIANITACSSFAGAVSNPTEAVELGEPPV